MQRVSIYNKGIAGEQKSFNFSASFNAFPLAVSEEMTTLHTHTHTHNVRTYCSVRLFHFFLRAREKRATYLKQRLCEAFVHAVDHTRFSHFSKCRETSVFPPIIYLKTKELWRDVSSF